MSQTENLKLTLPDDPDHVELLRKKADHYRRRIAKRGRQYWAPELRNDQSEYALRVIELLLEGNEVFSYTLSREIADQQGQMLEIDELNMAFAVINKYLHDKDFLISRLPEATEESSD